MLDVNLPDGDGREFLKRLRSANKVPVVFLTARDSEKDMLEGFDAGCDDYITKPFPISVLSRKIGLLLKGVAYLDKSLYYQGDFVYDYAKKGIDDSERTGEVNCHRAAAFRILSQKQRAGADQGADSGKCLGLL